MKFYRNIALISGLIQLSGAVALGQSTSGNAAVTLRQAAGDRVLIGTAVMAHDLLPSPEADLVAREFKCITPGNEMKPDFLQKVKGHFTFDRADEIVAFASAHDMQVMGHTLCWHQQSPSWLFADKEGQPLSREAALANLKQHIDTVVKHFAGKVKGWDVVNEAVNDGPDSILRDTPARRAIGDDFVLKAFEFAHQADPNVELYYNDYNIECDYKRERALKLVRQIRAAGLRIDGVGIQGHWLLTTPKLDEIERGLKAFTSDGFKVMITEMDVDPLPRKKGTSGADLSATEMNGSDPFKSGFPEEMQKKLAARYGELFGLILKYPQVTRITLWGTTDAHSWLNNFPVRGRTNYPMLWDRSNKPKPALETVRQALESSSLVQKESGN